MRLALGSRPQTRSKLYRSMLGPPDGPAQKSQPHLGPHSPSHSGMGHWLQPGGRTWVLPFRKKGQLTLTLTKILRGWLLLLCLLCGGQNSGREGPKVTEPGQGVVRIQPRPPCCPGALQMLGCQRQGREVPVLPPAPTYLPVFADAVHGVLVVAELHGAHLPAVGLPAHGALVLLHVCGTTAETTVRPPPGPGKHPPTQEAPPAWGPAEGSCLGGGGPPGAEPC